MLYLVGLGLNDEKDISVRGLEIIKKCKCFIELYTSNWKGKVDAEKIQRADLEENSQKILNLAKEQDIAILIPGDPLSATTHISLVIDAKKQGITVEIIHSSSIFSAIGETGLQLYKFGRTLTLPKEGEYESISKGIKENQSLGLHTLILLDPGMIAQEALDKLKPGKVVIAHFSNKTKIVYSDEAKDFPEPAVIIIPGKLHFQEKEYLEIL